jgi:hypothetical protein
MFASTLVYHGDVDNHAFLCGFYTDLDGNSGLNPYFIHIDLTVKY